MTQRRAESGCLAAALLVAAAAAQAQDATNRPDTSVQTRLNVTQTWTDNLRLDERNKDAALITTLSPGIRIVSNRGMLRGSLDYSMSGIAYLKSDESSRVQNSLSANGRAELIADTLYVDMRAQIGQQNLSAFGRLNAPTLGGSGSTSELANSNQRETGTLSIAPVLRGYLGSVAQYELRHEVIRTEARGSDLGDSQGQTTALSVSQQRPGLLSWWLQANRQEVDSRGSGSHGNRIVRAGLTYRPDIDWTLTGSAGQEQNDFLGGGARSGATGGVSVNWTPTPRTRVGADWQHHDYGDSHVFSIDHRLARSVWRFADTQSVMLGNTGLPNGTRTLYDQFFLLFASLEPDVVKRDVLVRTYLQSQGLSPDTPIGGGFLSAGPTRLRNQQMAVTFQGVRSSLTLQANRSVTNRLGEGANGGTLADTSRVDQRIYSVTLSHRLAPSSSLSLMASRQESQGDLATQSVTLNSVIASWNASLGPDLSFQLGARHSRSQGFTSYTENAVYANLSQQF